MHHFKNLKGMNFQNMFFLIFIIRRGLKTYFKIFVLFFWKKNNPIFDTERASSGQMIFLRRIRQCLFLTTLLFYHYLVWAIFGLWRPHIVLMVTCTPKEHIKHKMYFTESPSNLMLIISAFLYWPFMAKGQKDFLMISLTTKERLQHKMAPSFFMVRNFAFNRILYGLFWWPKATKIVNGHFDPQHYKPGGPKGP